MCYHESVAGGFMGIFDWLFGDTDDEEAQLDDMILMDMDDEDDD